MTQYSVLMHHDAVLKSGRYFQSLRNNRAKPGTYLNHFIKKVCVDEISLIQFIELLVQTKQPQIFAESAVSGDGSDWTQTELSILGDISIAAPVIVFDNGLHDYPAVHEAPFNAHLLFTPGALLRNGRGLTPVDWKEVTKEGQIDIDGYYGLYERRLLPIFSYADKISRAEGKKALITVPGLGCGQFAGPFRGRLGEILKQVLIQFLQNNGERFSGIRAVYYDPYSACENERHELQGVSLFVRPLTQGNQDKPQLCMPETYAEEGDDFSTCILFSVVAWDHVSWPGNDFYIGSRATDDGVKAAATNSMAHMTGVEGAYNPTSNTYDPPLGYRNWEHVVRKNQRQLVVGKNLIVFGESP